MKPKYTLGPWWRDDDGFIAAGSKYCYYKLADFDCDKDLDIDEREANKELAILAPRMFEAIDKLINCNHQEHLAVRLNDEETAAIEEMKQILTELKPLITI